MAGRIADMDNWEKAMAREEAYSLHKIMLPLLPDTLCAHVHPVGELEGQHKYWIEVYTFNTDKHWWVRSPRDWALLRIGELANRER